MNLIMIVSSLINKVDQLWMMIIDIDRYTPHCKNKVHTSLKIIVVWHYRVLANHLNGGSVIDCHARCIKQILQTICMFVFWHHVTYMTYCDIAI